MSPERKHKVVFLIPSMEIGGAERVLSIVLQNLKIDQVDLTLCVLKREGDFYHDVPDSINKINLKISRVRYASWKVYKILRELKPDLVFVFDVNHSNLIVALASIFLPKKIKYISRQAAVLTTFIDSYKRLKFLRRWMYKQTFRCFDLIVTQSEYMKKDLIQFFEVDESKIRVVNNPVPVSTITEKARNHVSLFQKDKINILAVGRLVYVKGYDLLIRAMTLVKDKQIHLTILGGETPESPGYAQSVKQMVKENNLEENVSFLGFSDNPYQYINQCDMVVMTSRSEAFPNVVIESNALGKPVLAFNCPGGVSEIIVDGLNGWLVKNGDVDAFARAIDSVRVHDLDEHKILQSAFDRYDVQKIITTYHDIISKELGLR